MDNEIVAKSFMDWRTIAGTDTLIGETLWLSWVSVHLICERVCDVFLFDEWKSRLRVDQMLMIDYYKELLQGWV